MIALILSHPAFWVSLMALALGIVLLRRAGRGAMDERERAFYRELTEREGKAK
jgi:hypothetical protein